MIRIEDIDGEPWLNHAMARYVELRNEPFEYNGHVFLLRQVNVAYMDVCHHCNLDSICDSKVRQLCGLFDYHLPGVHLLRLATDPNGVY